MSGSISYVTKLYMAHRKKDIFCVWSQYIYAILNTCIVSNMFMRIILWLLVMSAVVHVNLCVLERNMLSDVSSTVYLSLYSVSVTGCGAVNAPITMNTKYASSYNKQLSHEN